MEMSRDLVHVRTAFQNNMAANGLSRVLFAASRSSVWGSLKNSRQAKCLTVQGDLRTNLIARIIDLFSLGPSQCLHQIMTTVYYCIHVLDDSLCLKNEVYKLICILSWLLWSV